MTRTPDRPPHAMSFLRPLGLLAVTVLLLSMFTGTLLAQSTGTISGRVYDEATGKSLQGAIVRALGTSAVDYTDAEGRYTLGGLPAGPARIEIEYVGLDTLTREATVTPGTATTVDAPLKSNILQLQAFEVAESARGQALAINQQKTAAGIVNIVSEETFGAMVDGNLGYALQRLPGLTVDDDADGGVSGINIRGVSGDFNSFQIDGNRVPNSGVTSRSANTRQLLADGVTNIEVIKAPTPDRDGDAVGGIVNVLSRTAFQRDGREMKLSIGGTMNDLARKWSFDGRGTWGYNLKAQYSDIYSILGGDRNLGISFTASSYYTNRFYNNIDTDWERITVATNPQMTLPTPLDPGGGLPPFMSFLEASHSEYNIRSTNTYGFQGSIDFRTDAYNSFYFRPLYSHYNITGNKYETDWDIDKRFQDEIGGRKTYGAVTWTTGRGTTGANGSRASIGYIGTDEASHNNLYAFSTGGRHERNNSTLTYDFYYSWSKFERDFAEYNMLLEPIAQGYYLMEYDLSAGRLYPRINILNGLSPTDLSYATTTNLIIQPRKKTEEIYSAKADWEKKFLGERMSSALKVGAKYRASAPKYDQTNFSYAVAAGDRARFPFGNMLRPSDAVVFGLPRYLTAHPQPARELLVSNPSLFTPNAFATLNNSNTPDYDAEEETSAAYGQYSVQYGPHTILGGVRVERVEWSNRKKTVNGVTSVVTPRDVGSSYTNWLPGLHLRHALGKNLILRESYNRSYGRPSLGLLSRGRSINAVGNITDGNDNLKPLISDNFDAQIEYYTANGGLYSVGVFMKKIKDFTFDRQYRFDIVGPDDVPVPAPSGAFLYTIPDNGPGAENKGIEIIARQRLVFLPGALKGLSAGISATFTESEADYPARSGESLPLPGFSDFIFTANLEYSWRNFNIRTDYRYRSDYIEGLDADFSRDDWFGAREQVDAEIYYRFRKNLTLFVTGQNLTERPLVSYQGYKYFVEDLSQSGRKYQFGLEYKF